MNVKHPPEQRSWHRGVTGSYGGRIVWGGGHKCAIVDPAVKMLIDTQHGLKQATNHCSGV